MIIQVVDELAVVTPAMLDYLELRGPLSLTTFFQLRAADAARRLDDFEQQLQRRRMRQEHEAAILARRLANWDAIEAASPYRSKEIH